MTTPPVLPVELEDIILESLNTNDLGTLAKCALVSKSWLFRSRHYLFSDKKVSLTSKPWRRHDKSLHMLLSDTERDCSFWPHLTHINLTEDYSCQKASIEGIRLLSRCLSCATKLRVLELDSFWFSHPTEDETYKVLSAANISSFDLRIHDARSASPFEFLCFLGSLQKLRYNCTIYGVQVVSFLNPDWDPRLVNFNSLPSFGFHVQTYYEGLERIAPLIIHHIGNITTLNVYDLPMTTSRNMLQQVLQSIGPRLEEVSLQVDQIYEPDLISFEHNTSLRVLSVQDIGIFDNGEKVPSTSLTSAIATIRSRERFKLLRGYITSFDDRTPRLDETSEAYLRRRWDFISSFDWEPVEAVLLDKTLFPGDGPILFLRMPTYVWNKEIAGSIARKCLPQLSEVGNVKLGPLIKFI